tara:strand:+ start:13680 stop:14258 length:579 start_codon:yes stop_codon:yes gene_type:complete
MDGPIPGQSLTKTPRNALYERPPEIVDPNDAIIWHMQKLSDPNRLDNLLFTLEYGLPVKHATQAALTIAVAKGIHNIDVSLIIAPVIHKFIASTAEEAGIDFLHDFENTSVKEEDERAKVKILLDKAIAETPVEERDEGFEMIGDFSEATADIDLEQDTQGEIAPEVAEVSEAVSEEEQEPQEAPRGLMARG